MDTNSKEPLRRLVLLREHKEWQEKLRQARDESERRLRLRLEPKRKQRQTIETHLQGLVQRKMQMKRVMETIEARAKNEDCDRLLDMYFEELINRTIGISDDIFEVDHKSKNLRKYCQWTHFRDVDCQANLSDEDAEDVEDEEEVQAQQDVNAFNQIKQIQLEIHSMINKASSREPIVENGLDANREEEETRTPSRRKNEGQDEAEEYFETDFSSNDIELIYIDSEEEANVDINAPTPGPSSSSGRSGHKRKHLTCRGCLRVFSVTCYNRDNMLEKFLVHCIKQCIKYRNLGLATQCEECFLRCLDGKALDEHIRINHRNTEMKRFQSDLNENRPKWMAEEVFAEIFATQSFPDKIACDGCHKSFDYNRDRNVAEYEYYLHCIEDCVKYRGLIEICPKCKCEFIDAAAFMSHKMICNPLYDMQ